MEERLFSERKRFSLLCIVLSILLIPSFFLSFIFGRYSNVVISDIPGILLGEIFHNVPVTWSALERTVVLEFRMPRILLSMFVGGALSMAGASYQALFANPIASPDTLGVSQGASFGAALGILLGLGTLGMKISAFALGCFAVLLVFVSSALITRGRRLILYLLLLGMVVSAIFQAMVSILKFIADPENQLPQITYWLLGSFSKVTLEDIPIAVALFTMGAVPLFMLRWRMNLLSLSYYEMRSIGENITALRLMTVLCATLLTAASTAMTGGINWVGLIIPHMTRALVGNDFRKILPISGLLGALFLLVMDNVARSVSAEEIPISIMTSLVGAPVFFIVLVRNRKQVIDDHSV